MMQEWGSDILLNIIQYLAITDSGRFATTCRRHYYLVHQYRIRRGPELIASASKQVGVRSRQLLPEQVCSDAISKLQTKPNLALAFGNATSLLPHVLTTKVPDDTILLCARASKIQTASCFYLDDATNTMECNSHSSLYLANLPSALITPFFYGREPLMNTATIEIAQELANRLISKSQQINKEYKLFIVLATGDVGSGEADTFVKALQKRFPNAAIVGGICSNAFVSLPIRESSQLWNKTLHELSDYFRSHELMSLHESLGGVSCDKSRISGITKLELAKLVYNLIQSKNYYLQPVTEGICGIALAGDVPVHSIVSRGVVSRRTMRSVATSLSPDDITGVTPFTPTPTTPLYVVEAEYVRASDASYLFAGDHCPPYHIIRRIKDEATGRIYTPTALYQEYGSFDFLGIRLPNQNGFALQTPHPISHHIDAYLLLEDVGNGNDDTHSVPSLVGSNIDFYDLDGNACLQDMDDAMRCLKEQTNGKEILGAIMFSCSGRGPHAGSMINEDMADAKRFVKAFPGVPCLGFYAGGEIGPLALAAARTSPNTSVFTTGNACLQGFTAVFALFIVPVVKIDLELDDCEDNVEAFVREKLRRN